MAVIPAFFLVLLTTIHTTLARGPPEVTSDVERQLIVRAGETVRLSCPVDADPRPIFQWTKDDESIHQGWDRFRELSRSLKIKDLEVEDSGTYKCRATNGFGSVDVEYVVYVLPDGNDTNATPPFDLEEVLHPDTSGEAPYFTNTAEMQEERHLRLPEGSPVRLRCHAAGHPRPAVLWFFNGQMLTGDEQFMTVDSDPHEDRQLLRMENLQPVNSGNYMCRVFNRLGSLNFTYTLEVVERTASKPQLVAPHPENQTVTYGSPVMFQCHVHSEDQPHIQWLKRVDDINAVHDHNTTIKVNGQHFVVLSTDKVWTRKDGSFLNKLSIPQATERDAGMYICLGANRMGYSYRSAFLNVLSSPMHQDSFVDSTGLSLPVIIAVPAAILIVLIIVVICIVQKKRNNNRKPPIVRTTMRPPPQVPTHDKQNFEQYATLQNYNNMQNTPSREQIMKNYPSDGHSGHSDVSQKMLPMPQVPHYMSPNMSPNMMANMGPNMNMNYQRPPMHYQQHHHVHQYAPCSVLA